MRKSRPLFQRLEAISQQLDLTPQQKVKILPILRDELPKVQAIKNDNSLTRMQKVQQIRAIHQQTDPQMKAILSPEQYQKLQAIRQQTIKEATQTLRQVIDICGLPTVVSWFSD